MLLMMPILTLSILAYLLGSIPFGKLIALRYGIDIQKRGSGNIGFANVLRVIGWGAALPVLILDVIKGFIPAFTATLFINPTAGFIVGLFAIAGHLFPAWLRFRGGKGIATGLGVLLGATPLVGVIGFTVYAMSSFLLRNSSYASIAAGASVLVSGILLFPTHAWAYIALAAIALWTLRKNLFGVVPNYDI